MKENQLINIIDSAGTKIIKNQWINTRFRGVLSSGFKTLCGLQWRLKKKLYLHRVEMPITQRCSLKCKACASLIPYIKDPVTYDKEELFVQMDRLFACVDTIHRFRLLGGEPLLHPEIGSIIDKAMACDKLNTVDVVTNGTIMPSDELLKHMKDSRFTLVVSDYGPYSKIIGEIAKACDAKGVRYEILEYEKNRHWIDMGRLEKRGRTERELKDQLRHCGNFCRTLLEGKMYYCPRAAFGPRLGMPVLPSESVDLMADKNVDMLRKEIFELDQRKMLTICDRCNRGTKQCASIPAAEQL